MRRRSASWNFPRDFLWGIVPPERFLQDKDSAVNYIFRMRDKRVRAVLLNISWPECEPLKGNFNESYIEAVRQTASRLRNQNIEPVVLLNTIVMPQWQNLDHPRKAETDFEDRLAFSRYMTDALATYTKYFCITDSGPSGITRSNVRALEQYQRQIADHVYNAGENSKIGLWLSEKFLEQAESSGFRLIHRGYLNHLRSLPIDFLAIGTDRAGITDPALIFDEDRKPLLFLCDGLRSAVPEKRTELLADKLHDVWQIYQKGWPILGYLSEIDLDKDSPESQLYENSCAKNAFEIASDADHLPDKWLAFLKD